MQPVQIEPSTNTFSSYSRQKDQEPVRPECRICLQQILDQPDLEYCYCRGNLRYVHQDCLIEWTNRAQLYQDGKQKYCYCEICKARILLQTTTSLAFATRQQICLSIFCNTELELRVKRVLFVVLMVLLLGAEIALAVIFQVEPGGRGTSLLVALIAMNSIFLLGGCLYLLFKFLLVKKTKVVGVKGIAVEWQSSANLGLFKAQ